MSQSPIRPLSIGNVVTIGFILYRSHLKTYLQLALFASLWSLVPIYGWAKASAIGGTMSRLAFKELVGQPESVNTARSHLNPRMWDFFAVGLLVGIIIFGIFIGFYISFIILTVLSFGIIQAAGAGSSVGLIVAVLLSIAFFFAFIAAFLWIYSRFMIAEVPLAIEDNISSTKSIGRGWELTKGFAFFWRIQFIIVLVFTIVLPIYIIIQIVLAIFQQIISTVVSNNPTYFILILYPTAYILGLLANIWILPLWQTVKAVIYYDLRSRREGLGLELRDRS